MDPITAAIIAALAAGVTTGLAEAGIKKLVADGYKAIKARIKERNGPQSGAMQAIRDLESDPASTPYQQHLQQKIREMDLEQDEELLSLARTVLAEIQRSQGSGKSQTVQNIYGEGNAVAGSGGTAIINVNPKKSSKRRRSQ